MPPAPARPRVIVSVVATADGRITLGRTERLLDPDVARRWQEAWPPDVEELLARRTASIEARHRPTVVLEGSGTFVADDAVPPVRPEPGPDADDLRTDFLPYRSPKWFAVVDGRGRVPWVQRQEGDTSLLVLAGRHTPAGYLAQLRWAGIPYLVAGDVRVDLPLALAKLHGQLGAGCVVAEAGGGLNAALLRAGLVDELHVLTVPALVGGLGTPSVLDGPPTEPGSRPVRLRTVDVVVGAHGSVWTHYEL